MSVLPARPPEHEPALVSGTLAVTAAAAAVAVVVTTPFASALVGGVAVGLLAVLVDARARRPGRWLRVVVALGGSGVVLGALGLGAVAPLPPGERVLLVGSLLGPVGVGLGAVPLRAAWSRHLAGTGVAVLVVATLTRALVFETEPVRLFVALALALLAWDAAELSVGLGREVGRRARTERVEVARLLPSVAVAGAGVGAAVALSWLPAIRGSLPALGALLAGALLLFLWLAG